MILSLLGGRRCTPQICISGGGRTGIPITDETRRYGFLILPQLTTHKCMILMLVAEEDNATTHVRALPHPLNVLTPFFLVSQIKLASELRKQFSHH